MNPHDQPGPPTGTARLPAGAVKEAIARELLEHRRRMTRLARRLLGRHGVSQAEYDPDDAIQETLFALWRAADEGGLRDIVGDDDLWRYFHTALDHQVLLAKGRFDAIKRGGPGTSHAHAEGHGGEGDRPRCDDRGGDTTAGARPFRRVDRDPDQCLLPAPSSDEQMASCEAVDRWLARLDDPALRRVAIELHEGWTEEEIAQHLGVSTRTIRRKRELLRRKWQESELFR
jgi:DNA-directed RNA polymerase specialized sigma24 family protein